MMLDEAIACGCWVVGTDHPAVRREALPPIRSGEKSVWSRIRGIPAETFP